MQRTWLAVASLTILGCSDQFGRDITSPTSAATALRDRPTVALDNPGYALVVESPALAQPTYVGMAEFTVAFAGFSAPPLPSFPSPRLYTGQLVAALDASDAGGPSTLDGCSPFTNAAEVSGKIALILRGSCTFVAKARNAEAAGAIAVIIRDNVDGPVSNMASTIPNTFFVRIPVVKIGRAEGEALAAAVPVAATIKTVEIPLPTVTAAPDNIIVSTLGPPVTIAFEVSAEAFFGGASVTCRTTPPVIMVVTSGEALPVGEYFIFCFAHDLWQNESSNFGAFGVSVLLDAETPVITPPPSVIAEATGPTGADNVTFAAPTATDDVGVTSLTCDHASGSAFTFGTTIVTCTATDAVGHSSSATFMVTVTDTEPPVLTMPANLAVKATSTAGATVSFFVSATDVADANPQVSCTPPSGSLFPIGTTLVRCEARDAYANTANGSFTVTVQDARLQTLALQQDVLGLDLQEGIETSLEQKLSAVLAALASNRLTDACNIMDALINQVNAQAGKKISAAQAATLIDAAQQIRAAIGCPGS